MSTKEKLIERFLSEPHDFTYDELRTLLQSLGYSEDTKCNGSRVAFINEKKSIIRIHKPHPDNIIKKYIIKQVSTKLKEENLI